MKYPMEVGQNVYTVQIEYPHEYTQGFTTHFDTQEEAEEYASKSRKGKSGYSGYCQVKVFRSQLLSTN